MSPVDRLRALDALVAEYQRRIDREPTPEEISGIRRAYDRQDSVTAKLALGAVTGANTDWPVPHRREALRAYGLSEEIA